MSRLKYLEESHRISVSSNRNPAINYFVAIGKVAANYETHNPLPAALIAVPHGRQFHRCDRNEH